MLFSVFYEQGVSTSQHLRRYGSCEANPIPLLNSVLLHLLDLGDLFNFFDLSSFTQRISVEWVESALTLSSQVTV